MATRHRRNAGTFYDVINTSNGYVISRSHYDKADAVKSMRRIAAEDKRSPTYKNRKLKVVARPIPKDHVPTRSWKKKGKKWEYNPKTGTTVPAHVRINPRNGRIQVFVTPKVAEKLRGGKGLRVAGNPRTFKDVRIGETFYFAPATHGFGDSYSRGPFVKNGPRKYTEDRGTGKLIQHKIGSTSAKVQ